MCKVSFPNISPTYNDYAFPQPFERCILFKITSDSWTKVLAKWLFGWLSELFRVDQLWDNAVRHARRMPKRSKSPKITQGHSSNTGEPPTPGMGKFKVLPCLLILIAISILVYLVYSKGGKVTVTKDSISYEHTVTPPSDTPSKSVDSSSYVTLTGKILINGHPTYTGEVMQVYIKNDGLVQPVTPDGNDFILNGVQIPENNVIQIAVTLKSGETLSKVFSLPHQKSRIYNLGECLFTYSPSNPNHASKVRSANKQMINQPPQAERKVEINNPIFYGPTQIGDNNTQNNGPKPREVSESFIQQIESHAPSKNSPIHIYRRSDDAESRDYATRIVLALIKRGYTNSSVDGIVFDQDIGGDPVEVARQQRTTAFALEPCAGGYQLNVTIPANQ